MQHVNPKTLVPYAELPLGPEEIDNIAKSCTEQARRHNGYTPKDLAAFIRRSVRKRQILTAEREWLDANLPVGATISILGVTGMVSGSIDRPVRKMGEPAPWPTPHYGRVVLVPGVSTEGVPTGLKELELTVPQLRAILEEGFVAPRDPLIWLDD